MIAFPDSIGRRSSARPEWIDDALMDETRAAFEPLYGHALTDCEVQAILQTFGRLIDAIQEQSP